MSVLDGSIRPDAALRRLDDIGRVAPNLGVLALLGEWLDSAPGGLCVVDCADGYRVAYANRAAQSWASAGRLPTGTTGSLAEVVARVWMSGEPASLASYPLGQAAADGGRLWDVEVQPVTDSDGKRRCVLVTTREANALRVLREPVRQVLVSSDKDKRISQRERQVAELVALGLTNSDIAARLYLSRATVASHVAGILTKLRFRSRAQVAVWVVEQKQQQAAG
jgi:DNA-binding CsgD family transcriptional regulator